MKVKLKIFSQDKQYKKKLTKFYDDQKELVVGKMNHETAGVAINDFVRLNPKRSW